MTDSIDTKVMDLYLVAGTPEDDLVGQLEALPEVLRYGHASALLCQQTLESQANQTRQTSAENPWVPLQPAIGSERGFGPELSMGHTLAAHSEKPIAILKLSAPLPAWQDASEVAHQVLSKLSELEQGDISLRLRGLVWIGKSLPSQDATQDFGPWLNTVRHALAGHDTLPWVTLLPKGLAYEQTQSWQSAINLASSAATVSVDDLPTGYGTSLDSSAILTTGDRLAQTMLSLPWQPPIVAEVVSESIAESIPETPASIQTSERETKAPEPPTPTPVSNPAQTPADSPSISKPAQTRIMALMNQKGGVGKTTTAVSVGSALTRAGLRVLMIDLDPQAHLTLSLGFEPSELDKTLYDLFTDDETSASEVVCVADNQPNFGLLPAETNLAGIERELADLMATGLAQTVLRNKVADLLPHFDYVLLDCPPALNLLTINALTLATEVIVPMQAHYLAMQGLGKLLETITMVRKGINPKLTVAGVVLCMFESQTLLAGEIVEELSGFFEQARGSDLPWAGARVFDPPIRRNIKLAEAPSYGVSIHEYAPDSHGAKDYSQLAQSIAEGH